jgi:hypothetical protein
MLVLALGASLGINLAANGQEPTKKVISEAQDFPAPALPNPQLAQTIAKALQDSGKLVRYRVSVTAMGGVVDLRGEVADETQRAIVIRIARSTRGVTMVRDWLQVLPAPVPTYAPVQAMLPTSNVVQTQGPPILQPLPLPPQPIGPGKDGVKPNERIDGALPGGQLPDPLPIFQAPPGPNPTMQPPPLPPYAWPTYAPYNNYSRVAYPLAYPYEQFPFIGPMYPFPRVPLGWRSVSLTWEDGHWWYHRNPTGHDWWRIRYH